MRILRNKSLRLLLSTDWQVFQGMHKLARHLARPSALTHLTRLQHPHHYAALRPQYWRSMSSASGKSPGDRFDRLAARLKPGLGEDDLAKTIAELVASTGSQARLESLGPIFQKCMEGLNRKEVDKLVEQYLMNPPEELILDATSELGESGAISQGGVGWGGNGCSIS